MISCKHAHQLFDRYFDGELSPSLQAELHAHQLSCPDCQSEMAMMETIGEVVRTDRCERKLGDSFTDRVLASAKIESPPVPARVRWGRRFVLFGSPMAAAASIALAVMLILPSTGQVRETVVAGEGSREAAPAKMRKAMMASTGRVLSPEEKQDLDQTPQMSAVSFLDGLVAPMVQHAQTTLDGAKRSAAELEFLFRVGLTQPTEKLAVEWRTLKSQEDGDEISSEGGRVPAFPWDPANLNRPAPTESRYHEELEAL